MSIDKRATKAFKDFGIDASVMLQRDGKFSVLIKAENELKTRKKLEGLTRSIVSVDWGDDEDFEGMVDLEVDLLESVA